MKETIDYWSKKLDLYNDDDELKKQKDDYYRDFDRWYSKRKVFREKELDFDLKDAAKEQEEMKKSNELVIVKETISSESVPLVIDSPVSSLPEKKMETKTQLKVMCWLFPGNGAKYENKCS